MRDKLLIIMPAYYFNRFERLNLPLIIVGCFYQTEIYWASLKLSNLTYNKTFLVTSKTSWFSWVFEVVKLDVGGTQCYE